MTQSPALTYLEEHHDRFQAELIELLRISSISHDPAYKHEMNKAANWLANKLRSMVIHNVDILPIAGHSFVYGEWFAARGGASAPTVLIYGHYDVQSPEPLEDWKSEPFEPTIQDEN